ncbi:hypothetical protein RUND412_002287 [Rhizina undulata]
MSFARFPVASLFSPNTRDFFHLLDELSTVPTAATNTHRRAFSPNFDIHETAHAYILEGELPGIEDKSKINIKFTDAQTLLVRGKIERSYNHTSEGDGPEQKKVEVTAEARNKSQEVTTTAAGTTETAVLKTEGSGEGTRYWVSERTVGEFQRSFSFPGSIDIDEVKASLELGILKVVVPKKEHAKGRRIEIH